MNDTNRSSKSQHRRAGYYRQKAKSELRFIPGKYGTEIVELMLPSGPRRLGSIHLAGRTFKSTRARDHILRNSNAISINEQLLKSNRFDWIVIEVEGKKFVTSTGYILEFGNRICYSKAGYEVQVSLPLNLWGINNARKYHSEKYSQTQLFNTEGS